MLAESGLLNGLQSNSSERYRHSAMTFGVLNGERRDVRIVKPDAGTSSTNSRTRHRHSGAYI